MVAPRTAGTAYSSRRSTSGTSRARTSRSIPPPIAVSAASTRTPNRSNCLRTATRPPESANTNTPTRSSASCSRTSGRITRRPYGRACGAGATADGTVGVAPRTEGAPMHDLRLVGVHDDGEHLLLVDDQGDRYLLGIDDALRAAVRRDRAHLGQLQLETQGGLRPRDVQSRIRAGATSEEVAALAGWSVE